MDKNDSIQNLPAGVILGKTGIYRDFEHDYWYFDGLHLHVLTSRSHVESVRIPQVDIEGVEASPALYAPFEWVGA
jgi:hypothetical protein